LVTDPFGEHDEEYLRKCFPDVCRPFKEHFIVDLNNQLEDFVSSRHRRNVRKALRSVCIGLCDNPVEFIDDWCTLYAILVERHVIHGIPAFSRSSFTAQFSVPGLFAFRAVHQDRTVAMLLWYVQNNVGYYHLGASNEDGYTLQASFGLFWESFTYFKEQGLRWLNLGAGAGVKSHDNDGLSKFKRGWATGTRTAYFCGVILDPKQYSRVVKAKGTFATDYFPAYRKGEFI
jgi:lipid II:glycine glycyltransferase (peptidoglycan interpeptide bridge formation enzyme)